MSDNQKEFFENLSVTDYGCERGRSFATDRMTKIVTNFVLDGVGKGSELLEFGAGKGHWTLEFLKLGFKVTAVDFSGKSLEVLKRSAEEKGLMGNLKTLEADITKPLFEENFDRVFCIDTLHHVSNPEKVVENMTRAVKVGGKVSALEPNPLNLWWWFGAPIFDRFYNLGVERGIIKCFPWQLKDYFLSGGMSKIETIPLELFPAISPDRFQKIIDLENFVFKLPFGRYFSGLSLIGGWK